MIGPEFELDIAGASADVPLSTCELIIFPIAININSEELLIGEEENRMTLMLHHVQQRLLKLLVLSDFRYMMPSSLGLA